MRRGMTAMVFAVLAGLILPGILFAVLFRPTQTEPPTVKESEAIAETGTESRLLTIPVLKETGPEEMELDRYLVGVVMAEMPASFHPEALKAQAVVARTYALRRLAGNSKHEGGAVCTDPGCCQGYTEPDRGAPDSVRKITEAVEGTTGLVLTYDGVLIDATYFSCSGGSTEDAVAVWGSDVPYLKATDSPGEEDAVPYYNETDFDAEEFCDILGISYEAWDSIGNITYTHGGGVDTMEIGGEVFTGTQLRRLLGLPSTMITMEPDGDAMTVITKGYGHRVGMSQYGADAMAEGGADFREILTHYYQGTEIRLWEGEN